MAPGDEVHGFCESRVLMQDLPQQLLQGVDPNAPGAFSKLLHNMLVLVPWWPLVWFTVACAVIGAVLGWWRGRIVFGVALGLVMGPIAWAVLWALPPGRRGPARRRLARRQAEANPGDVESRLQTHAPDPK